jgi:hypothetical protein
MPGIPQTLEVPPPVSVQTILYGIYQALGGSSGGGGSGISSILTPRIIWVDATNGNNATAVIGRMDKPFQTLVAAYAAGVAGGVNFALVFMPNANPYTLTLAADLSEFCVSFGAFGVALSVAPLVRVDLTATPSPTGNSDAGAAFNGTLAIEGIWLNLTADGQGVTANDGVNYNAGNGGNWTVRGNGFLTASVAGGSGTVQENSSVMGGNGGNLMLAGGVRTWDTGVNISGGVGVGGASTNGNPGTLTADNCDLRIQSNISGGDVTLGRCSYTTGTMTITNNKGGNADWPA